MKSTALIISSRYDVYDHALQKSSWYHGLESHLQIYVHTVKPCHKITPLIQPPRYYDHSLVAWTAKAHIYWFQNPVIAVTTIKCSRHDSGRINGVPLNLDLKPEKTSCFQRKTLSRNSRSRKKHLFLHCWLLSDQSSKLAFGKGHISFLPVTEFDEVTGPRSHHATNWPRHISSEV